MVVNYSGLRKFSEDLGFVEKKIIANPPYPKEKKEIVA